MVSWWQLWRWWWWKENMEPASLLSGCCVRAVLPLFPAPCRDNNKVVAYFSFFFLCATWLSETRRVKTIIFFFLKKPFHQAALRIVALMIPFVSCTNWWSTCSLQTTPMDFSFDVPFFACANIWKTLRPSPPFLIPFLSSCSFFFSLKEQKRKIDELGCIEKPQCKSIWHDGSTLTERAYNDCPCRLFTFLSFNFFFSSAGIGVWIPPGPLLLFYALLGKLPESLSLAWLLLTRAGAKNRKGHLTSSLQQVDNLISPFSNHGRGAQSDTFSHLLLSIKWAVSRRVPFTLANTFSAMFTFTH